MARDSSSDKPSYGKALVLPALAAGAGLGVGSVAGGATARFIAKSRGIQSHVKKLPKAKRLKALKNIRRASTAVGGTAGAMSAGLTAKYVQDELNKLNNRKQTANEKTAAVYEAYSACLEELL